MALSLSLVLVLVLVVHNCLLLFVSTQEGWFEEVLILVFFSFTE